MHQRPEPKKQRQENKHEASWKAEAKKIQKTVDDKLVENIKKVAELGWLP
jgi:hypothetical protein